MSSPKIKIYSLDYCPYCVRAKHLLNSYQLPFEEIIVDASDDTFREELQKKSGMRTFPQIFYGDKLIGGYTELKKLDDEQGLSKVLI